MIPPRIVPKAVLAILNTDWAWATNADLINLLLPAVDELSSDGRLKHPMSLCSSTGDVSRNLNLHHHCDLASRSFSPFTITIKADLI